MKQILEKLIALQKLQLNTEALSVNDEAVILKLREGVPTPILNHFDRLIAHGKKGVAIARHGVCTECHLRLSSGTLGTLADATEVHICDNCGRYLFLPEGETTTVSDMPAVVKAPVKVRAKRARAKAGVSAA